MIVAKLSIFLLTVQIQEKSNDLFLEILRDAARFCQSSEIKNAADSEDEIKRMSFILRQGQQTLKSTNLRRKQLKQKKSN